MYHVPSGLLLLFRVLSVLLRSLLPTCIFAASIAHSAGATLILHEAIRARLNENIFRDDANHEKYDELLCDREGCYLCTNRCFSVNKRTGDQEGDREAV